MTKTIALGLLAAAIGLAPAPVLAKGCLKGAAVGAVAGHLAGHHGKAGAAVGCAMGHHHTKMKARR